MLDLSDLYTLYTDRRAAHAAAAQVMVALAGVYDGELRNRIEELDEVSESSVPNIVAQGVDAYAEFTAEAQPTPMCPAVRPNITSSRRRAEQRSQVIEGWWQGSKMHLLDYQRFRYYYGFGTMPVIVRSDPKIAGIPRFHALNPIGVLPGYRVDPYSPEVPDCFVVTQHPAKTIHDNYGIRFPAETRPDMMLEVVEYVDAEQITVFCTGAVGPATPFHPMTGRTSVYDGGLGLGTYGGYWSERGTHIERLPNQGTDRWLVTLSSSPNFAGRCLVSCPGVISLSKVTGFVNGILGKHNLHARLTAMTIKAIAKGILPNEWVLLDPNTNGEGIVREADGVRNIRGIIDGGQIVVPQINPGYQTFPLLDRLESYQRDEAGISTELGGSSGSNIRTRARGEEVSGMSIDRRVREAHVIAEAAREHEARLGIDVAKGYGGSRPRSFTVSDRRQAKPVTYVATDLFENDDVIVRYPLAGTNLQGQIIMASQSIGTGMLSVDTARRMNPLAEADEATKINVEAAETVLRANIQMLVESSPADAAFLVKRLKSGDSLEDVWEAVQKRIQERQATVAPEGEPLGPAFPGSPEAQPGLGEPGVANAPASIPEPPQSIQNLAALVSNSRNIARGPAPREMAS